MTPTMTRMAYLTLRGISIAHGLRGIQPRRIAVLETHPGAVLALHGAPIDAVRLLKKSTAAQENLLAWLSKQGIDGLTALEAVNDHLVAACAAAFGAWQWDNGSSAWLYSAEPPLHPFPFAC
jgi:predicted nuclease with RNAse H fold